MKSLGKFNNDMQLEVFLSLLRANNIKYVKKGTVGNFIGVAIGVIGEQEIFVKEENYLEATSLLNDYRGE